MLVIKSINPDKWLSVWIATKFSEDVLHTFEERHSKDMRPRNAIEAAKAWLSNPCEETASAYAVASDAAYAAAHTSAPHSTSSYSASAPHSTSFYSAAAASAASYTVAVAAYRRLVTCAYIIEGAGSWHTKSSRRYARVRRLKRGTL
jgi:hypothetical protein